MEISGKSFIVTGAASGLGEATARMIVNRGGTVIIADLNPAGADLAAELGPAAVFVATDVTQEPDGLRALETAKARLGGVHGLVNCAGIAPAERIIGRNGPHSLDTFTRTITVNLIGTFNMLRLAASAMKDNAPMADGERGVIVNTASVAAFEGQIGQAAYAASKAGVAGLTLPAARELARFGIRVVTIAPGLFLTPMMAGFSADVQKSLAETVQFPQRLGKPEEYAELVAAIVAQPMLNGETIRLDGALRMAPK
ncbi:MAG TPA: 3-hydroxyacyl-CoA dehydrogenase [Terracidiphilus sp.]|jgi:NAD(P)-dependent dehydrogenase (short-subunit alcohol dehydrogenase family)|nr:3-hydroxyacyl-CoA dehydrogenase [Terracidiphilus sp.]